MRVMNDLNLDYLSALKQYLAGGDEAARSRASEVGRRAMVEGLGVLDMAVLHHAAVDTLAPDVTASDQRRLADAGAALFYELLAPFEMSLTGYRAANQELKDLNETLQATLNELRTAQAELVRKERLATLGQLAGSVAHELRNPFGVISNSVYLLDVLMPPDPPALREYVDIIKTQMGVSQKIVRDLLDFTRINPPVQAPFSISALIDEQLTQITIPPNVRMERDDAASVEALADRVQVGQIMLNLLTNAIQAVGAKAGTVRVRISSGPEESPCARIDVIDTGSGIPQENLEKIFDPLFTTKARGIGLGLSVSRQLARANGGEIVVTSEVGVGSTFSLSLKKA